MIAGRRIAKDQRAVSQDADDHVDGAVVVEVAKRRSAPGYSRRSFQRLQLETAVHVTDERRRFFVPASRINLFDVVEHVTLRDKQIFPAVIVEIGPTHAPAGAARRDARQPGCQARVAKQTTALIVIERVDLAGEVGHDQVGAAVVVVVAEVGAHPGVRFAVFGEGHACLKRTLAERSIPMVAEQQLCDPVAGDEHVGPPVVIIIGEGDAQPFALVRADPGRPTDILERAVATIAVKDVANWREAVRIAVGWRR